MRQPLTLRPLNRLLAAALLTLLATLAPTLATPARADPAIFAVHGGAAPLYLFGSIHILRPGLHWRTPRLNQILAEAQEYWFETTDKPGPGMLLQLVAGLDLAHPLHTQLPPADYARLTRKLAGPHGTPGAIPGGMATVDVMRPWLASMIVLASDARAEKPGPSSPGPSIPGPSISGPSIPGVDEQLMSNAGAKPVFGLETIADLVSMMNAMPQESQLAMLRSTLRDPPAASPGLDRLQDAWRAGNLGKLATMLKELGTDSPELSNTLLKQRNDRWIGEIDTILHAGKPALVTVGAAHLIGPDGLPAQLRQRGYRVERIQ